MGFRGRTVRTDDRDVRELSGKAVMTMSEPGERVPASLRTEALEQLLTERDLIDPKVLDEIITTYETNVGPLNGAKVIAKAWTDPEYRRGGVEGGKGPVRPPGSIRL